MTRRNTLAILGAAITALPVLHGKDVPAMREIFETSQKSMKGLMLYVKGQSIAGIVTKIDGDFLELRSREYSRIVVRVDSIDAAAISG
jgi:hypothetical protein